MGNKSSAGKPPVIAECKAPMYCMKRMGGRHLLLGGGGGAAKTGVPNQIEGRLLTFDKMAIAGSNTAMTAKLASVLNTDTFATMNMDVVNMGNPENGRYLIAAGHDHFCDIYETVSYTTDQEDNAEKSLGFNYKQVVRIVTDMKGTDSYQKCVRFDKSTQGQRLVTGGSDGHVRVWDVKDMLEHRSPETKRKAITEVAAHNGDVDDIDVSVDGRTFVSVGYDGKVFLWDMNSGRKLHEITVPAELAKTHKVRSVRFAAVQGTNNDIFVVAYNSIQRNSQSSCLISLWGHNKERQAVRSIQTKEVVRQEAISSMCVSPCGNFVGLGTMGGSVAIFDTHELKLLKFVEKTHGIFVTGVEFLERVARDISVGAQSGVDGSRLNIPGAAAGARAMLVSLSADQTVQVHRLGFERGTPMTTFLLYVSILSLVLYYIIWTIASR